MNVTPAAPCWVIKVYNDAVKFTSDGKWENHSLHTTDLVNESIIWFPFSHFTHLSTPPTHTDWNSCHVMVLRKQTTHCILLSSESNLSSNCEQQIKAGLFLGYHWYQVKSYLPFQRNNQVHIGDGKRSPFMFNVQAYNHNEVYHTAPPYRQIWTFKVLKGTWFNFIHRWRGSKRGGSARILVELQCSVWGFKRCGGLT